MQGLLITLDSVSEIRENTGVHKTKKLKYQENNIATIYEYLISLDTFSRSFRTVKSPWTTNSILFYPLPVCFFSTKHSMLNLKKIKHINEEFYLLGFKSISYSFALHALVRYRLEHARED